MFRDCSYEPGKSETRPEAHNGLLMGRPFIRDWRTLYPRKKYPYIRWKHRYSTELSSCAKHDVGFMYLALRGEVFRI